MSRKKILIVDDSELIRKFFRRFFRDYEEYVLLEAETVKDALRLFRKEKPDLISTDLELPDGSGLEILGKVREKSLMPIIVLTGTESFDESEHINVFFISKCDGISPVARKILKLTQNEKKGSEKRPA